MKKILSFLIVAFAAITAAVSFQSCSSSDDEVTSKTYTATISRTNATSILADMTDFNAKMNEALKGQSIASKTVNNDKELQEWVDGDLSSATENYMKDFYAKSVSNKEWIVTQSVYLTLTDQDGKTQEASYLFAPNAW